METGNLRKLLIPAILIAMTFTFACSGARDVYDVSTEAASSITDLILPDKKPVLKKKILVAPVINRAGIGDQLAEKIREKCVSSLSRDKYLAVSTLKKWNDAEPEFVEKEYGAVLNPAYLKKAGDMGMNIIMACIIHPIEISKKRTGIWPFRKDVHNVLLSISINAVDTVNGTLIDNKNVNSNIDLGQIKPGDDEKWVPDDNMLTDEVLSLTEDLCSSLVEKLRKAPWQSRVSIDGDNMVLKAGKDIGIDKNTVFELFKKGQPLESFSGKEFYVFGEKIGESGVKSVSGDKTVLAVNANGDYKDTAFVRVKRD